MDRLIAPNSVPSAQADIAPSTGTPQFATDGNPASNAPATQWPAYQYNAIQEELIAILTAAAVTPDRTNNAQIIAALTTLFNGGRFLGVQIFQSSATYTPETYNGVKATKAIIKAVGGGGAGGGCPATTSTTISLGSGGNAGAEGELLIVTGLAAMSITIGAGGTPGAVGSNPGGTGGSTIIGSLMSCAGGLGGLGGAASTAPPVATSLANPAAQVTGTGNILVARAGKIATVGIGSTTSTIIASAGADSSYGQGGYNYLTASTGYGAGGSGATAGPNAASAIAGQAGRPGYALVYEFA